MNRDSKATLSWQIKTLKSPVDGIEIRYAIRPVEEPRFRILFLNGRSEFIEKYADLPEDTRFGDDAYWVTMDHRGQGASGGPRAHVNSYDDFARDVQAVVEEAFGSEKFLIVAHSMGGLIATYGAIKGILAPTSMTLCAPLFGILTPMPITFARLLARTMSRTPFGKLATGAGSDRRAAFEGNPLTQSRERFEAMINAPYKPQTPTFQWVNATFQAIDVISDVQNLKRLKIPVAIMVGSKEAVVDRAAYQEWFEAWKKASGRTGSFEVIKGSEHEILNEEDQYRDLGITFLNQNIRP